MKQFFCVLFFGLLFFLFFLPTKTSAQIKLHDSGHVSLGDVSMAYGIQIQTNGCVYLKTKNNNANSWANISYVNNNSQKHWIVSNSSMNPNHVFYVLGSGVVWHKGAYIISNSSSKAKDISIIGGKEALQILSQLNGYYFSDENEVTVEDLSDNDFVSETAVEGMLNNNGKRKAGLSAEELELVFPESVRTNPEASLGIDYASVIAVLVEAINEQQAEIELLKNILKENGILKP